MLLGFLLGLLPLSLAQQSPFSAVAAEALLPPPTNSLHPVQISRIIELGGALTRTSTLYTLKRDSAPSNEPLDRWIVGIKGQEGFLEAKQGRTGAKEAAEITRLGRGADDVTFYSIALSAADQQPGSTTIVALSSTTSHQTTPKPKSLLQVAESMAMYWSGDLLDIAAGLSEDELANVEELKIRVKLPGPRILEFTTPQGFTSAHSKGGATITFTSNDEMSERSQPATVHYVQPEPVVSVRKLDRLIEVSHWGSNLAVQDGIDLFNSGAELKGHFSRLDHQKMQMTGKGSALAITSLGLVLPPRISSPYFIDIVGNVSTSRYRPSTYTTNPKNGVKLPSQNNQKTVVGSSSMLELTPRYPLMGGWNYTFTVGYDAPLGDFLKRRKGGDYVLSVPFLTPVKDVAFDDVTLRVRLSEGSKNIRVHTPFPVDSLSFPQAPTSLFSSAAAGYDKTYLDTTGRPTIVIKRLNCTDRHGAPVIIEYDLPLLADLFQKPLAIAATFSTVFAFIIVVRKLQWSIGKRA